MKKIIALMLLCLLLCAMSVTAMAAKRSSCVTIQWVDGSGNPVSPPQFAEDEKIVVKMQRSGTGGNFQDVELPVDVNCELPVFRDGVPVDTTWKVTYTETGDLSGTYAFYRWVFVRNKSKLPAYVTYKSNSWGDSKPEYDYSSQTYTWNQNGTITFVYDPPAEPNPPKNVEVTIEVVWPNDDDSKNRPDKIYANLKDGTNNEVSNSQYEIKPVNGAWTLTKEWAEGEYKGYLKDDEIAKLKEKGYVVDEIVVNGNKTTIRLGKKVVTPAPTTVKASVMLKWLDDNDAARKRPASVTAKLSNGQSVQLNADNNWEAAFDSLLEYENGKKIEYTWTFEGVPAEYEQELTGGADATLTCSYYSVQHTTDPDKNDFKADIDMEDSDILDLLIDDDEEKKNKADIIVYLTVEEEKEEDVPSEEKTAIMNEAGEDKIAAYLDIKLFKQIGKNNPEKISNTGGKVHIKLKLEDALIPKNAVKDSFYVIYYHGGAAKSIPASFNVSTKELTFKAHEFSTYSLVYKTQKAENVTASMPKTGDNSMRLDFLFVVMLVALSGLRLMAKKRIN